jgi:hypothetical protein
MPANKGKKALVVAKEDLLEWPKAKAFTNIITKEVTTFL